MRVPFKLGFRLISFVTYGLVGVLLVLAGMRLVEYIQATTTGDSLPSPNQTITESTQTPSEKAPEPIDASGHSQTATYTVAAELPRVLKVASIGLESYVQRVGLDQYGQVAVPTNIYFTGWYVKSAQPGQPGVTLIDGHLGGRYNKAIFADLDKLQIGDEVLLQKGDLSWLTYTVETTRVFDPAQPSTIFKRYTTATNELHLVTCNGVYMPTQKTYDKRLLVVARLKE